MTYALTQESDPKCLCRRLVVPTVLQLLIVRHRQPDPAGA
jgi:hypothetical protein